MMLTTPTGSDFDTRNRTDRDTWTLVHTDPCLTTLHAAMVLLDTRSPASASRGHEQAALRELQKIAMLLEKATYDRFAHTTEAVQDETEDVPVRT